MGALQKRVLKKVNAWRKVIGSPALEALPLGQQWLSNACPLKWALDVYSIGSTGIDSPYYDRLPQLAEAIGDSVNTALEEIYPPAEFVEFMSKFDQGLYPELEIK